MRMRSGIASSYGERGSRALSSRSRLKWRISGESARLGRSPVLERPERRQQIIEAIDKIKPGPDAPIDFAVDRIEWMLDQAASVVDVSPTTPRTAAEELERAAAALAEVKAAF